MTHLPQAKGLCAALLASTLFISGALAQGSAAPPPGVPSLSELYTLCSFYPERGVCEPVYARAANDSQNPAAASAAATYRYYARYLDTQARALTDADTAYLKKNSISLPDVLTPNDLGALSSVINDPALQADASIKLRAVNAFISRAVQAHMYCVLHACNAASPQS